MSQFKKFTLPLRCHWENGKVGDNLHNLDLIFSLWSILSSPSVNLVIARAGNGKPEMPAKRKRVEVLSSSSSSSTLAQNPRAPPSNPELQKPTEMEALITKLRSDGASKMWILHFFSHFKDDAALRKEKDDCHYCQLRAWNSSERYPIGIINNVPGDTSSISPKFRFIEENVVSKGVEFADESFLVGCDCTPEDDCTEDCACLQDVDPLKPGEGGSEPGETMNPYQIEPGSSKDKCLKTWMLESRRPIYECHEKCNCAGMCASRVVGRGRKVPLQVFKTHDGRGWGLRAMEDIKPGQFVGKYVGELLTPEEAQERRRKSKAAGKKDIYLFALDKFHDPNSFDPRLRREPYEIDGEFMSGPTRFINHSCDPNLRIFAVVKDHANKPVHELCFFATRIIPRYTELTFDYLDGVDGDKGRRGRPSKLSRKERDEATERGDMTKCLCRAHNCRSFLWV